ncbi:hypothetical protein E2C01_032795 [Portunus trituberculatus]|uniref:Uncharacterized protein n=1 Tax=Portunus trituberculatus TaxID=210409 RepID=A0A5B7F0K2_PORTR|nr:hypothetical protein [Portunus trituberculatus]
MWVDSWRLPMSPSCVVTGDEPSIPASPPRPALHATPQHSVFSHTCPEFTCRNLRPVISFVPRQHETHTHTHTYAHPHPPTHPPQGHYWRPDPPTPRQPLQNPETACPSTSPYSQII